METNEKVLTFINYENEKCVKIALRVVITYMT